MVFTKSSRAIDDAIEEALLEVGTSRDIARKAGVKLVGSTSTELAGIMGTFSLISSSVGYVLNYPVGVSYFPDGTNSNSRYADLSGASEGRLMVNIAQGGDPETILTLEGTGNLMEIGFYRLPGLTAIIVGDWQSITPGPTLLEWKLTATSSGSVTVGLCQLQIR